MMIELGSCHTRSLVNLGHVWMVTQDLRKSRKMVRHRLQIIKVLDGGELSSRLRNMDAELSILQTKLVVLYAVDVGR